MQVVMQSAFHCGDKSRALWPEEACQERVERAHRELNDAGEGDVLLDDLLHFCVKLSSILRADGAVIPPAPEVWGATCEEKQSLYQGPARQVADEPDSQASLR